MKLKDVFSYLSMILSDALVGSIIRELRNLPDYSAEETIPITSFNELKELAKSFNQKKVTEAELIDGSINIIAQALS